MKIALQHRYHEDRASHVVRSYYRSTSLPSVLFQKESKKSKKYRFSASPYATENITCKAGFQLHMDSSSLKVAVLYQAKQPPATAGIIKPMKPGGYADSGADIAYTLKKRGVEVICPSASPEVTTDLDWVFSDTSDGIKRAIQAGANCLWLNTVLYKNHPIAGYSNIKVVGQSPWEVEIYDDKWYTNNLLREHGLPIPRAELITFDTFMQTKLPFLPPVVLKPVRGRGSEGVVLISSEHEYEVILGEMFSDCRFGNSVYVEEYLPGQEITVTVMPPGQYVIEGKRYQKKRPWCLPGVARFNHEDGIAPYNGKVAVIHNSRMLGREEQNSQAIRRLYLQCESAGALVNLKAPIRIDCRANADGEYFLFDLNMKPNLTGPSRPHRSDQESLSALAARQIGWDYGDLLINVLQLAWKI